MKHRVCAFAIIILATLCLGAAVAQTIQENNPAQAKGGHKGMLKKADKNNDGQISRDEWTRNERGFARLDRNNDGVISRDEAQQAGEKANRGGRRQAGRELRKQDTNQDGRISRDEWKHGADKFDRLDANKDNVLTAEEFKHERKPRKQGN
ncbi:MAG: EF-hand domain-containing protein [Blastocatellia bacterium]